MHNIPMTILEFRVLNNGSTLRLNRVFPPIKPACTVNATRSLFHVSIQFEAYFLSAYLLIDSLSAVFALFCVLDNWIMRHHGVKVRQSVECESKHAKRYHMVDK